MLMPAILSRNNQRQRTCMESLGSCDDRVVRELYAGATGDGNAGTLDRVRVDGDVVSGSADATEQPQTAEGHAVGSDSDQTIKAR